MVVGDTVNGIGPLISTWYYFQPALTVECLITSTSGTSQNIGIYDGTLISQNGTQATMPQKIFINNTIYFAYFATGTVPSYSGIQIK
tara:strand:+ start:590 stop:850 length:261 start_codon:yes stop_codon:yes gene_type:complete